MNRDKRFRGGDFPLARYIYHRYLEYKARRVNYTQIIESALKAQPFIPVYPTVKKRPGGYLIEITNACNLNCKMCNTQQSSRPMEHMEVGVFEKLLTRICDEGITSIGLHTVGEPFMHPKLDMMLEICRERNVTPSLSTNAMFPSKIRELYKRGLLYGLRFSIDGLGDTYESIRQGAKWKIVVESLELVRKINHGLHAYKLPLSIDSVLCSDNLSQVRKEYLRFMSRYTFPHMIRFPLINSLSPDTAYFHKANITKDYYVPAIPCSMPFTSIYFNNHGEATLCCRDYNNEMVIGSALDRSVQDLWMNDRATQLRIQHLDGKLECCNRCWNATPWANKLWNAIIRKEYYDGLS